MEFSTRRMLGHSAAGVKRTQANGRAVVQRVAPKRERAMSIAQRGRDSRSACAVWQRAREVG
jgi:hypothetical protein